VQVTAAEFPFVQLKIISNQFIEIPGVRVIKQKWQLDEESEQLRSIDIGIMPLADTLWARGKCGYKILQYFGAAIPAVASPVGINNDFIRHMHNGMLASTPIEWKNALQTLILNPALRKRIGLAGREEVHKYSLESYTAEYAKLLHEICLTKNEMTKTASRL